MLLPVSMNCGARIGIGCQAGCDRKWELSPIDEMSLPSGFNGYMTPVAIKVQPLTNAIRLSRIRFRGFTGLRNISSIRWTADSIEHVAWHGIKPDEVEEVCFNESDVPFIRSGKENLHYVFGKTVSGRFVFVVVRFLRPGEVKVITARDMNTWERNYYKKRGK
jgi:uncharacterized protein